MTSSKPARVRFAPSPTGKTHLGSARTALYNYLLAKQTGGQFILRIEDTDRKRYDPDSEKDLMDALRWLGLDWDEGPDVGGPNEPYRQSARKAIYQEYAQQLIDRGHAYPCFCSPERLSELRQSQQKDKRTARYDGRCRGIDPEAAAQRVADGEIHVIRFKMPQTGKITVTDRLRGDITVENSVLDDFIIVKSDGLALYHLAAMVDDHLMGITHVFRGEEWLPTLPLHAHIYRAFDWPEPIWIHLSVFLNPTGKGKMSKRFADQMRLKGNSIFVQDLQALGYLPEAVINWIALMGWSYDDKTEYFTLDDLVEKFSLDKLNPSPTAINFTKFDHFNGLHIRNLSHEELARRIRPFLEEAGYVVDRQTLLQVVPIVQVRLKSLEDAPEMAGFFFKDEVHPELEDLIGKNMTREESRIAFEKSLQVINSAPEFTAESLESPLRELVNELELKAGQLFGLLRNALTAQQVSPPIFESMEIMGRDTVNQRITNAIQRLS